MAHSLIHPRMTSAQSPSKLHSNARRSSRAKWTKSFSARSSARAKARTQLVKIPDERHAPIGIGDVAGLDTGATQGVTRVGPARAHVAIEAIDEAGQID